ncbi:hypothetical protein HMPREF0731_1682 [Pseudoroseomonas cervicalis ATCC 49957]|uniref:Uncharacterized protein n=1 Tax=Pseudoroseomonas cervicalis ATCC 49957 TaxID=525371 RepID=D5RKS2_9PROT|nr:hypothetical protein HMPREF0731_1682 [Pseudoroseomonas cervicalis ATCC 49957]
MQCATRRDRLGCAVFTGNTGLWKGDAACRPGIPPMRCRAGGAAGLDPLPILLALPLPSSRARVFEGGGGRWATGGGVDQPGRLPRM